MIFIGCKRNPIHVNFIHLQWLRFIISVYNVIVEIDAGLIVKVVAALKNCYI